MLTEKQKGRLLDPKRMSENFHAWLNEKCNNESNISDVAMNTIEHILQMPKAEQNNYVIIDDVLVPCRDNLKTWQRMIRKGKNTRFWLRKDK